MILPTLKIMTIINKVKFNKSGLMKNKSLMNNHSTTMKMKNGQMKAIKWKSKILMKIKQNRKSLSNSIRKIFLFLTKSTSKENSMNWQKNKSNFWMSLFPKIIKTLKSRDLNLKNMMKMDFHSPKSPNIKSFLQQETKELSMYFNMYLTNPLQYMILISSPVKLLVTLENSKMHLTLTDKKGFMKN